MRLLKDQYIDIQNSAETYSMKRHHLMSHGKNVDRSNSALKNRQLNKDGLAKGAGVLEHPRNSNGVPARLL